MPTDPSRTPPRRPRAGRVLGFAALAFAALSAYRAHLVDAALGDYLGCDGCLTVPVLGQDLWLAAAVLALFLLARALGSRLVARLMAFPAAGLMLVFVMDVVVQRLLSRRLMTADVVRYGADVGTNLSVATPLLRQADGWFLLIAGTALVVAAGMAVAAAADAPRTRGLRRGAVALLAMAGLGWTMGDAWYTNRLAYQNVVNINLANDYSRAYGAATEQRLQATPPPPRRCEPGAAEPRSVIVLVVESWSLHHSALFSGLDDLSPALDAAAREGSWFPTFYSNGFSTEGGLISLLTGATPISSLRYGTVMAFTEVQDDFHRELARRGYDTRFFTTGDLGFGKRAQWLRHIGIRHAEGAEQPAYDGLPRFAFGAASDQALFDRFLAWYDRERTDSPFMATVLTVGMHPPYGGTDGEAQAVRRTDVAAGKFIDALAQRGFFRDGLLLVVGDHRAMVPLRADEREHLGPDAWVRVPAFVRGASGLPAGAIPGEFQQADLIPSLQSLLMERSCRGPFQGRMLGPSPVPAQVMLVADPMDYSLLHARHGGRDHVLRLDGDDSRWLGPAPEPGFDLPLEVARLRIARDRPPPP